MKIVLFLLAGFAVLFGALTGRMDKVNLAALQSCGKAVELCIGLIGAMALWSGLMKIAEKSGLCKAVSKLLSPVLGLLFKGVKASSHAMELISMNVTANILGLGNAATPLGIAALTELDKTRTDSERLASAASNDMVILTVLNTASIQLVPTTVAILRLKYGSSNPMDIIPCVLVCSVTALTVAITVAKLLGRKKLINGEGSK